MDFVFILRELWSRRLLVAAVAVFAIAVGGLAAFRPGFPPQSRHYEVGIASARALVDTPSSQVVDLGAREDANAGVLPARATLLATLLTTSPLRDKIAERAGVRPDRLVANADTPTDPGGAPTGPLATEASVSRDDATAYVLTLKTDVSLPLINVNTQAPDAKTAAALADGTVDVLEEYLGSVTTDDSVPATRRLVVKKLGSARAVTEQRGPSRGLALGATLLLFGLGCGAIVIGGAVARDWRTATALERASGDWLAEPGPNPDPDDPASRNGHRATDAERGDSRVA